jgi:hypothetical protein
MLKVPCSKSHVHIPLLRSFIQKIHPGPRLIDPFRNMLAFYGEVLLAPRPTPKLEDHPLSIVRGCLFNIFAANLQLEAVPIISNPRMRYAQTEIKFSTAWFFLINQVKNIVLRCSVFLDTCYSKIGN